MGALRDIENQQPRYGCKRCGEKFSSGQALGGHQTKHKVEDQDAAAAAAARGAFSTRDEQPVLIVNSSQQQIQEELENLHQQGPSGVCLFCLKRAQLKLHFDRSRILASAIKKVRRGKLAVKRGGRPFEERSLNSSSTANTSCGTGGAPGTNEKKAVTVEEESGGRGEVDLTFRLWPVGYN